MRSYKGPNPKCYLDLLMRSGKNLKLREENGIFFNLNLNIFQRDKLETYLIFSKMLSFFFKFENMKWNFNFEMCNFFYKVSVYFFLNFFNY